MTWSRLSSGAYASKAYIWSKRRAASRGTIVANQGDEAGIRADSFTNIACTRTVFGDRRQRVSSSRKKPVRFSGSGFFLNHNGNQLMHSTNQIITDAANDDDRGYSPEQ